MMKKLLIFAVTLLLFACKKNTLPPMGPPSGNDSSANGGSGNGGSNPGVADSGIIAATAAAPGGIVTSYSYFSPSLHYIEKDTLIYNSAKNLIQVSYYDCDSSNGLANLAVDSGTYSFTVDPITGLPSSYAVRWFSPWIGVLQSEIHDVFYDGLNRLVKDTLIAKLASNHNALQMMYYTYSGSNIICTGYSQNTPGTLSFADTITLNNGNVISQSVYSTDASTGLRNGSYSFSSYSGYANPLYNASQALNIGVFFQNAGLFDAMSRQNPAVGIASYTLDAKGRVLTVIKYTGLVYRYTYQ